MASIGWALLLFLAHLQTLLSTSIVRHADAGNLTYLPVPFLCHPNQAKALLQLKKSFLFGGSSTRLLSWRNGTDCCLWEGVVCDTSSGQVTILDLNNRYLSSYSLDPALFSLVYLRRLDLSMNDLGGYIIPATGFERFTFLTHLNLSNSGLYGQIPIGISKLVNLLSLDLSTKYFSDYYYEFSGPNSHESYNYLRQSNLDTLVANLSNLRELYLDHVYFPSGGEEWGESLSTSVPHLQVLSLAECSLTGPIHKSLSRLDSLATINLQGNYGITPGPFPEFFMDFLNLTVLQLSGVNLMGWFPSVSFKSKKLRALDLSGNQNLLMNLSNFSNVSSLETLVLDWNRFSYARPMTSSNFPSLKELSLGGYLSVDLLNSFGRLGSLSHLDLNLDSITELGPIFSWIGHHESLMSLVLSSCNLSEITPTLLSN